VDKNKEKNSNNGSCEGKNTDIIASITACSIGRAVIHVLMYTKTFKTDIIVFIYMGLGLWCLMQLSKYFSSFEGLGVH
jgi:hypothetical protein